MRNIIVAYCVVAIVVSGYAANAEVGATTLTFGVERPSTGADRIFAGYFCGLIWPMYISYKAFEGVRAK